MDSATAKRFQGIKELILLEMESYLLFVWPTADLMDPVKFDRAKHFFNWSYQTQLNPVDRWLVLWGTTARYILHRCAFDQAATLQFETLCDRADKLQELLDEHNAATIPQIKLDIDKMSKIA